MSRKRASVMTGELPKWLNAILVFGTLATVVYQEIRRPLRRSRQDKVTRDGRNLAVSLLAAATVGMAEKPVTAPLALSVHRERLGLLKLVRLPMWLDLLDRKSVV